MLTVDGRTNNPKDARSSLVTVSQPIDCTMFKYIKMQNLNKINQTAQELLPWALNDPNFSTDAQQSLVHQKGCYACQSLDNVKMYKYTKFYQNFPCGSRVIGVFANYSLTVLQTTHTPIIVHTCELCNKTEMKIINKNMPLKSTFYGLCCVF